MRLARLTQDAISLDKSPTELTATCTDNHLWESLDCPDCFDTMLKFYDWDKMKYICENCGLTIANPSILSTYVSSRVRD
ncbi:MAG TPA: hypothetical protein VEP90_18085 [Methylomirabilota bacterium]|nr:hypothetical protein [Methylomirabilota bacterium]